MKTGMRMIEGWARKVLRMSQCQQEASPRSSPGRIMVAIDAAITCPYSSAGITEANGEASAIPFPIQERREAAKMSRNLGATEGQR